MFDAARRRRWSPAAALDALIAPVALLGALALGGCAAAPAPAAPGGGAPAAPGGDAPVAAAPEGLVATPVTAAAALAAAPFDAPRRALVPPGWSMSVWARLPGPRLAAWAPDGALLVSRPGAGEVDRLVGDGRGPATATPLLTGLTQPHGLAFAGSTLHVAESDRVEAVDYGPGGRTGARRTEVSGLPDAKSPDLHGAYAHALKSVAVARDGSLLVSVGSTANVSPADRTATPPRASILRVPAGGGAPEPFAVGVRNGTGLAIAPDGTPWTAVNNRDNLAYPYPRPWGGSPGSAQGQVLPAYVDDHPSEALAALTPGRDLGWPFCHPDPDPQATGPHPLPPSVASPPFARDVQTNADGRALDCSRLAPVERGLGAHSAPLGLSFTSGSLPAPYAQGALVGVHGSWNREVPRAPEVSFFDWTAGRLGAQRTLVGGFQAPDGTRWGRPVAAVVGPDGAVYVTDDQAGAVYRVAPPGH